MLVLARKRGEVIYIGDEIRVVVQEIRGDKVRIGIQAPSEITVHRSEVWHQIQRHKSKGEANVDGSGGDGTPPSILDQTPVTPSEFDRFYGNPD